MDFSWSESGTSGRGMNLLWSGNGMDLALSEVGVA